MIGLTKIIMWGKEDNLDYFKDKLVIYYDYCNKP